MSDSTLPSEMPGVLLNKCHEDDPDIITVCLQNNNEDVDLLKLRLKELTTGDNGWTVDLDQDSCSSYRSDSSCEQDVKVSLWEQNGTLKSSNKHKLKTENDSLLCLSTETLIDQGDQVINSSEQVNKLSNDKKLKLSIPMNGSHGNVNNTVKVPTSNVTSGLLISPTSLTEDVHVLMGDENKRMSTVLESLDLHLVYIPTTQQLIATKQPESVTSNQSTSGESGVESTSTNNAPEHSSSNVVLNGCVQSDESLTNSPVKMAKTDSSSLQGIQLLSPGSLDDASSIYEHECLIHVEGPDQFSCDNSDFVCNFPRINTNDSLLRTFTDASSLSSISTGTDFSVSAASLDEGEGHCIDTGDGGFMEISLHSRNSYERTKNPSLDSGFEDKSHKPKNKKGLTGFLSRNLFSRKSKDSINSEGEETAPGWKLFGKVPPKKASIKDPSQIKAEFEERQREEQGFTKNKKDVIEVMSTTALILENRPRNLPSKNPEERERHQREYESMVEAAKRKEQKELKQKKKQKQHQLRQEEQLVAAAKTWTHDIMPAWDTMKHTKKARDLWWLGIPPNVRGKVWRLAFGNDLNITQELYEICLSRATDRIKMMSESPEIYATPETCSEPPSSKESSVEQIQLDVSRTFPQLCIFQKGGPYHDLLHSLLGAYACYRPDVGYVQGMSFIAAVLLLNMEVADAFIVFANLLNRPCQQAFFRVNEGLMKCYFETYQEFFKENMPTLEQHFNHHCLTPDLYLYDWIFTLFTRSLPLDVACRVWDIFCRDGEEFLFRTSLGILKCHEDTLFTMDFIHLAQFLTKLPEMESYDHLFKCIDTIQMTRSIDKRRFNQVLAIRRGNIDVT